MAASAWPTPHVLVAALWMRTTEDYGGTSLHKMERTYPCPDDPRGIELKLGLKSAAARMIQTQGHIQDQKSFRTRAEHTHD